MNIAELIGGNSIEGISLGTVVVDGEELKTPYEELYYLVGSISVSEGYDKSEFITELCDLTEWSYADGEKFVEDNSLYEVVVYSTYVINDDGTLTLRIDT